MRLFLAARKHVLWIYWSLLTLFLSSCLAYALFGDARHFLTKAIFLPAGTTSGHHQIEIACDICHDPMHGINQEACLSCHGDALKASEDSHPRRKFTNPRNASRVELLDARLCITCHREHRPDDTHAMGVTQPNDFCFPCHSKIAEDRPSHAGLDFNTCASSGCHNYHDNRAIYEDFLTKHLNEPNLKENPHVPLRNLGEVFRATAQNPIVPLTTFNMDARTYFKDAQTYLETIEDWESTAHARAGVNCLACHGVKQADSETRVWRERVDYSVCKECHEETVQGFLAGKHGMRLAQGLDPMQPSMARLPMKSNAEDPLTCNTCHKAHRFDTRQAAVETCLTCHDDAHSRAYKLTKHFRLWEEEISGRAPSGTGVSCATCHLPREAHKQEDLEVEAIQVQHNQNTNLRPNEKMIRSVCMDCHGLGFSIDALADRKLVKNNFNGIPTQHVKSMDWAEQRLKQCLKKNTGSTATEPACGDSKTTHSEEDRR
jgi:hypothetical protein